MLDFTVKPPATMYGPRASSLPTADLGNAGGNTTLPAGVARNSAGQRHAISDFFTTSECRDLLFHVQEARVTIPMLKAFITSTALHFWVLNSGPLCSSNIEIISLRRDGLGQISIDGMHSKPKGWIVFGHVPILDLKASGTGDKSGRAKT